MNISDRQIFKLKKVLFIDLKDGKKIETFGLSSFIFIDKKSKNNDFYSNAIISNDKTLLFPVNVSYNVDIFENFEFPTPRGIYNPNDNEIYLYLIPSKSSACKGASMPLQSVPTTNLIPFVSLVSIYFKKFKCLDIY